MSFHAGWVHIHSLIDESMRLVHEVVFDPTPVTTKIIKWEDVHEAIVEPFAKLIISRPD